MNIPEQYQDLLRDETNAFLYLSTIMKDGTPQVTPVWFNWDGQNILINSAKGRLKDKNMRARPQVALVIADPKNPYRYIQVRGKVVDVVEEGAREHINALNLKYTGSSDYPGPKDEVRVIYRIEAEHIQLNG